MKTNECQVVMLPTEDKTKLFTSKRDDKLHYHFKGNTPNSVKSYQHLYVTSDEEIKEGDHYLIKDDQFTMKAIGDQIILDNLNKIDARKIIATTSDKFDLINKGLDRSKDIIFPRISQSFIEQYCKEGGINKVLVEYENNPIYTGDGCHEDNWERKVNSHNKITIYPIKDSWIREEVEKEIIDFATEYSGMERRKVEKMYLKYKENGKL